VALDLTRLHLGEIVMRDNLTHEADRWAQERRELADEGDGNALWSAVVMLTCMAVAGALLVWVLA
jgi:hypothetical protein